jgi:hypothetical protein
MSAMAVIRRILVLFSVLWVTLPYSSQATHYVGSEIFYEYIGDSTGVPRQYKVSLILYRRVVGITWGNSQTLDVTSSCFPATTLNVNAVPGKSNVPVAQYADCVDSMLYSDVSSYLFEGYINLPGKCADFRFSFHHCCLNTGATYGNVYADSTITAFYNEALLNNTMGPNNSPISLYSGPKVFCVSQKSLWSHAAIETDQDSIFFEVLAPLANSDTSTLNWLPGFSKSSPLDASNYNFNHNQRLMSFTPNNQGYDRIRLRMVEWRFDTILFNWFSVGETNLDLHVFYSASCSSTPSHMTLAVDGDTSSGIPEVSCGDQVMDVLLSERVLCSSLASDGSDFVIHQSNGNTFPIIGALASPCGTDLFTDRVALQLFQPINANDTLTLITRIGRDGNTLITKCGAEVPPNDTSLFYVQNCTNNVGEIEHTIAPIASLYPNPCIDILHVKLAHNNVNRGRIIIYDQIGRILKDGFVSRDRSSMNISDLEPGFYVLKFVFPDFQQSLKFRKI